MVRALAIVDQYNLIFYLRPSLPENYAGVIHATSPIWMKLCQIEGTECQEVIGFVSTTLHDWTKKSKTKTNHDSLALVFPRLASATCNRTFPSHLVPLFQNEASFQTMKMS